MEEQGKANREKYSYDAANRQVGIVSMKADGIAEKLCQTNRYDGEGMRYEAEENSKVIRFLFDRGELAQEKQEDEEISYVRGYHPISLSRSGKERIIGIWEGTRGNSMYTAYNHSNRATRANLVLQQFGQKGIAYEDCIPNFRPVSEHYVSINNMTSHRYGVGGNFWQTDEAFARYLNEHPNEEWLARLGVDGEVTRRDVSRYRRSNGLTWHEENDGIHMDF